MYALVFLFAFETIFLCVCACSGRCVTKQCSFQWNGINSTINSFIFRLVGFCFSSILFNLTPLIFNIYLMRGNWWNIYSSSCVNNYLMKVMKKNLWENEFHKHVMLTLKISVGFEKWLMSAHASIILTKCIVAEASADDPRDIATNCFSSWSWQLLARYCNVTCSSQPTDAKNF